MQEEQPSREDLLKEIEKLRQEVEELKTEKADLEILLETTTQHSDTVEEELHQKAVQALIEGKERFRAIAEATPIPVIITRLQDGAIVYANPQSGPNLGLPTEDLIGRNIFDFFYDPADRQKLLDVLAQNGFLYNYEIQGKKADNTPFWVVLSVRPLLFDGEQTFLTAFYDISDRKRMEEALLQSQQMLQLVLDNIPQYIFWKDRHSVYLGCNQNFASLVGVGTPENINGKTDYDIPAFTQEDADSFRDTDSQVMETGEPELHIVKNQPNIEGRSLWVDVSKIPIYDAEGNAIGILGTLQDITERKQVEEKLGEMLDRLYQFNQAYERFVPRDFLYLLNKESIVDIQLGDQVQQEMSVLFADIRDFTKLSESMTPEENFQFINSYLSCMEPAIRENNGFTDKYIGDAIMALFGGSADDAVKAGIAILNRLTEYNKYRAIVGYAPIHIGIGINTGSLMLGTVGGQNRMNGTAIGDAVNLASRIEGLTKDYGVSMLISQETFLRLKNPNDYAIRLIDRVKVKGKSIAVTVYEVFDGDPSEVKAGKLATTTIFEQGLLLFYLNKFRLAKQRFQKCLLTNPKDKVARIYLQRCEHGLLS